MSQHSSDGSTSPPWLLFFTLLTIICLAYSVRIPAGELGWYSETVKFSNWRGKEVDYSTNAIVTDWYQHPRKSEYYRAEAIPEMMERLARGDTVMLGVDYYGFFGLSAPDLPWEHLQPIAPRLQRGEVVVFRVYLDRDSVAVMDEVR